jgi:hypothetical protein
MAAFPAVSDAGGDGLLGEAGGMFRIGTPERQWQNLVAFPCGVAHRPGRAMGFKG